MTWLKQSTAADVEIGPIIDDTDFKSAETGQTLAQADCQLIKNGGAAAQKNDATSATHLYGGHYKVPLNTTDTGTLGRLRLMINKTGCLPAFRDFEVVPANVWDSYFGADLLQVDTTQVGGTTQTARDLGASVLLSSGTGTGQISLSAGLVALQANQDVRNVSGNVTGSVGSVTGAVGSVTGAVGSVTGNVGGNVVGSVASVTGNVGGNVVGSVASVTGNVGGNVVGSVGSVSGDVKQTGDAFARLGAPAGASVSADIAAVKGDTAGIKTKTDFLPSAAAGAAGGVFIAGANAATSVATALTANITGNLSGSVGSVTGAVGSVTGAVGSVTGAVGSVTGAVGSVTGNVGGNVVGSVGSVTGAVGSVTGAVGSVTGNVGGNVVGSVASVTAAVAVSDKTGFKLAADGLDSISTTGPAGVASNFREMVVQLWRRAFKKATMTATQLKTYADDGTTVVTTQTVADDGSTQTQGAAT